MKQDKQVFFAELTDLYGGEANYSWVTRFKVYAKSRLGAIQKLSRVIGLHYRHDGLKYVSESGATCIFIDEWENDYHDQYKYEILKG